MSARPDFQPRGTRVLLKTSILRERGIKAPPYPAGTVTGTYYQLSTDTYHLLVTLDTPLKPLSLAPVHQLWCTINDVWLQEE